VLSHLYGCEIDVVRLKDRIFIMSGGHDVESERTPPTTISSRTRTISGEYVRAMLDCDLMQNALEAATVVAIVSGLARGLTYAAECRLAGRSLREHEGRRVGLAHAPSPARP
jgi:hypothetical protein